MPVASLTKKFLLSGSFRFLDCEKNFILSMPSYSLTTVQQPVNIMVRETVEILIEKIENSEARPQKIKIDGPLILRNSSKTQKGNS